eukprot:Hpha_TRINITY_DN15846_c0_g2::TRINITY_DN15846_c0_g2_i3::g.188539::m.188539
MGLYWAITGFSGYSMKYPYEFRHVVTSLICAVCGLAIFAVVIAYMSTLLKLMGTSHQAHMDQVEALVTFCDHTKIGEDFTLSLLEYHRMLWGKTRQAHPDQWADLFAEVDAAQDTSLQLPGDLSQEMRYFANFPAVEGVPALRALRDPSFIVRVISLLEVHFGSPSEPIFLRGTSDDTAGGNSGMWFLASGSAEARVGGTLIETFAAGGTEAYWGEIVSLGLSETQGADVFLTEYSILYHMPSEDFRALVEHDDSGIADSEFRAVAARRFAAVLEESNPKRSDSPRNGDHVSVRSASFLAAVRKRFSSLRPSSRPDSPGAPPRRSALGLVAGTSTRSFRAHSDLDIESPSSLTPNRGSSKFALAAAALGISRGHSAMPALPAPPNAKSDVDKRSRESIGSSLCGSLPSECGSEGRRKKVSIQHNTGEISPRRNSQRGPSRNLSSPVLAFHGTSPGFRQPTYGSAQLAPQEPAAALNVPAVGSVYSSFGGSRGSKGSRGSRGSETGLNPSPLPQSL